MRATTFLAGLSGRTRLLLHALLLTAVVVLACGLLPTGTAVAAAPAVAQCNGADNVGGQEVRCTVTVTNSLDLATGVGSSTVTVQECHGPAGAPVCSAPVTTSFNDVTTAVNQCNGSGSGGGGVVACSVSVTNTITGDATTSPATINQCNGSGGGGGTEPTVQCSPLGSTTGATIDQCNDAGNGGGGSMRVQCQVSPSTQTAALLVTIDQCNGSGNGGGATVTCSSSITHDIRAAAAPQPSATPSPTSSAAASPAPSPSATASATPTATPTASTSPSATASPPAPAPAPTVDASPVATPVAPAPEVVLPPVSPVTPPASAGPVASSVPVLPVPGGDSSVTLTGGSTLPRTGADVGALVQLGVLLTAVGGAMLLLLSRPTARGRHARH